MTAYLNAFRVAQYQLIMGKLNYMSHIDKTVFVSKDEMLFFQYFTDSQDASSCFCKLLTGRAKRNRVTLTKE